MRYTKYLTRTQRDQLEYETVSRELRAHLTRLVSGKIGYGEYRLFEVNKWINLSRSLIGLWIYVLECDNDGDYFPQEYAWHEGELHFFLSRLSTVEFIELLCDLIAADMFEDAEINTLLREDGTSFTIHKNSHTDKIFIDVLDLSDIDVEEAEKTHPNIRALTSRMEHCLEDSDNAGVLHTSASIFETLAKDIIDIPSIKNQPFGGFFDRYRNDSRLPSEILDFILETYRLRNSQPLAGHGSTSPPTITKEQAVTLCEVTKAFVRIEYTLQQQIPQQSTSHVRGDASES